MPIPQTPFGKAKKVNQTADSLYPDSAGRGEGLAVRCRGNRSCGLDVGDGGVAPFEARNRPAGEGLPDGADDRQSEQGDGMAK